MQEQRRRVDPLTWMRNQERKNVEMPAANSVRRMRGKGKLWRAYHGQVHMWRDSSNIYQTLAIVDILRYYGNIVAHRKTYNLLLYLPEFNNFSILPPER